jgi:hemin uptake protein HemP
MLHAPKTPSPDGRTTEACGRVGDRVDSQKLLGPRGELVIVHNGREYRLRRTQNGKLILTA